MVERMVVQRPRRRRFFSPAGITPVGLGQLMLAVLLSLTGGTAFGNSPAEDGGLSYDAEGRASYYSSRLHGRPTANGEQYDETAMTAAHPYLPFDTQLCVTNLNNGRSTAVRVNDRGPFVGGRIIDVSLAAARELGMLRAGTARVRVKTCNEDNDEDN